MDVSNNIWRMNVCNLAQHFNLNHNKAKHHDFFVFVFLVFFFMSGQMGMITFHNRGVMFPSHVGRKHQQKSDNFMEKS